MPSSAAGPTPEQSSPPAVDGEGADVPLRGVQRCVRAARVGRTASVLPGALDGDGSTSPREGRREAPLEPGNLPTKPILVLLGRFSGPESREPATVAREVGRRCGPRPQKPAVGARPGAGGWVRVR